ncbi:MAG: hypothetical protein VYC39_08885 [Myxococcota bacterium]|nr:hypothetical protein [Myxococcota bacterium]
MKKTLAKTLSTLMLATLTFAFGACGGTEAELCAQEPEACLEETSDSLKAGSQISTQPALSTHGGGDILGKRVGAICAAGYPLGSNQTRTVYCSLCCNDNLGSNPSIPSWNTCIAECNSRLSDLRVMSISNKAPSKSNGTVKSGGCMIDQSTIL